MLSSEAFHFWKWRWLLMVLTILAAGFIFLKNKNSVLENPLRFQMASSVASQNEAPFYQEETIDPNATYRMAHVASMTELPDGTLVTTWYAGSGELPVSREHGRVRRAAGARPARTTVPGAPIDLDGKCRGKVRIEVEGEGHCECG